MAESSLQVARTPFLDSSPSPVIRKAPGWLESKSGSVCADNAIEIYLWSRRMTTSPFSKKRAMARCLPSGDQAKEPILWAVLLDR